MTNFIPPAPFLMAAFGAYQTFCLEMKSHGHCFQGSSVWQVTEKFAPVS